MSALKLLFLGSPRLELDGRTLTVDTRKATALLAYLAVSGEPQPREALAALLWPDLDEHQAKATLRRTLSTLKTAVGDTYLTINREVVALNSGSVWCDVAEFRRLLTPTKMPVNLETAVNLYRDDFLAGFSLRDSLAFDDWQLIQAQNLRRELEVALEKLVRHACAQSAWEKALPLARRWLNLDPLREEAHRQLMHIYAGMGQPNAALRQYRECVRILEAELGVSPLPETTALYQEIQEGRRSGGAEGRAVATPGRGGAEENSLSPLPLISSAPLPFTPPAPLPLVGRGAEMVRLQQVYRTVGPDGRLLTIIGEVGIGKTRLAEDFAAWSQGQGAFTLSARCYEGESNLAYAPLIQALRDGLAQPGATERYAAVPTYSLAEAARLLPELAAHLDTPLPATTLDVPGAQNRFFDGIGQTMAALLNGCVPGILWLDDAHWLDSASLELLLYLLRRWQQRPYLILLCWRNEEMPNTHPLAQMTATLHRLNVAERIPLARLTLEQVAELVTAVALPPDLPGRLYQETEGLPYFVAEYLHALATADTDQLWEIPGAVRDLLLSRLAQVDETGRQLLQTAAAIGRAFAYEMVQTASGRSEEETVAGLENLVARGILVEQTAVYDFSHEKLRALTYEEMGLARRRLLHRRLAEILAESARHQPPTTLLTAQIATHYRLAGKDEEAAFYFAQAGDQARLLFAHQEALYNYQTALALGYPETWRLHEACGDVYIRLGNYAAALASYETAVSLPDIANTGQLEHKLGQVYMRQGEWGRAETQLALAEEQYQHTATKAGASAVPADLARLYIDWSHVAYFQNHLEQATQWAQRAQQMAESPQTEAQCANILGILARHEGDFAAARAHLNQSLLLAERHNLVDVRVAALNNLALVEAAVGHTDDAQTHLQTALALCQTSGDRHREAALHNNLADLFHQMGEKEKAMVALKTAVAIYADIGGQPGAWQPEIWKLTEW